MFFSRMQGVAIGEAGPRMPCSMVRASAGGDSWTCGNKEGCAGGGGPGRLAEPGSKPPGTAPWTGGAPGKDAEAPFAPDGAL